MCSSDLVIKARAIIDLDTTQYFLVTFDQNGTHLDVATRTCDIALPSVPDVAEVVIPDKLRDVFRRDVVMTAGDFVSGTDGGAKYTPPAEVVVLGADLANPATDPLPTEADQTNAVDQDEDGHPGVTVEADVAAVCQGWQKLYVALRTTVTLDGTVLSSNEIVGDMEATLEQEILGMSDPCLSASDGIEVEVLPGSVFRARRIDGANDSTDLDANSDGAIDCEELTAGVETVFGD